MTKDELISYAWEMLERGVKNRRHPFHQGFLAYTSEQAAYAATVTVRRADRNSFQFVFNADIRSPKAQALIKNPGSTLLFYSVPDRIQIRALGTAAVHHLNQVSRESWDASPVLARRCYLQLDAPGTTVNEGDTGLPEDVADQEPTLERSEAGYVNFATVILTADYVDLLKLEFTGNRRLIVPRQGEPRWVLQ